MSKQNQAIAPAQDDLATLAERIRAQIFDQHNLIKMAIEHCFDNPENTEALLNAIYRLNDDLYRAYLKLVGAPDAEGSHG